MAKKPTNKKEEVMSYQLLTNEDFEANGRKSEFILSQTAWSACRDFSEKAMSRLCDAIKRELVHAGKMSSCDTLSLLNPAGYKL
jgi:hypothetical protein